MNKSCDCPWGCCGCGPINDNETDVFYDLENDEFFMLVEGASAMSPVGWCGWSKGSNLTYLGKLGDDYYQFIGRTSEHELELKEFKKRHNLK